jgi:hypothetical protein
MSYASRMLIYCLKTDNKPKTILLVIWTVIN